MIGRRTWTKIGWVFCAASALMMLLQINALAADNVRLGYLKKDKVNIRTSASTDSSVVTRLSTDDTLVITGSKDNFFEVSVDGKTGYVVDEYARTYSFDKKTVNASNVTLRAKASTDSQKLTSIDKGDVVNVYDSNGDFYKVTYGSRVGYVAKQFIDGSGSSSSKNEETKSETSKTTEAKAETPKTEETKQAEPNLEELKSEAPAVKKDLTLSSSDPEPAAKAPEPSIAELTELELEEIGIIAPVVEPEAYLRNETTGSYSEEELYLCAQVVYAEARGQVSDGYKAVASVIYNRIHSSSFPDTIKGVAYQSGQFSVVNYGSFASSVPSERAMESVKSVFVDGQVTLPENIMYFKSERLSRDWGVRTYYKTIGGNMFYS